MASAHWKTGARCWVLIASARSCYYDGGRPEQRGPSAEEAPPATTGVSPGGLPGRIAAVRKKKYDSSCNNHGAAFAKHLPGKVEGG